MLMTCADALVFLMERHSGETQINIGWGEDVSIRELAEIIATAVGFEGGFRYDTSKPDGAPRKLLDVSKLAAMGWRARIPETSSHALNRLVSLCRSGFVCLRSRELALGITGFWRRY